MADGIAPTKRNRKAKKHHLTRADTMEIVRLRTKYGLTQTEIADRMGVTSRTVINHLKKARDNPDEYRSQEGVLLGEAPRAKRYEELAPEVRERLDDYRLFRWHYFRRETPNFQLEAAEHVDGLEMDEALLILWPPGAGKSWQWTHDYPVYAATRARALGERFAMLIVSKTEDMGKAFIRRIAKTLENNTALIYDFGIYKPEFDIWRADALVVDGFDLEQQGKEPNFILGAYGSQIYGWRVSHILCDDLVDKSNGHSPSQTDKLEEWFSEELLSRQDKGARVVVPGTRWSSHDLYGRLLRKRDEDGELLFKRMVLPLHDKSKCGGENCRCKDACEHHPEYPEGCSLWSEHWPMRRIKRIKADARSLTRFEFQYNQVETAEAEALVSGDDWEVAKDQSRKAWDIPPGSRVICTLDPAPVNWSVFQCWAYRKDLDVYTDSLDGPVAGVSRFAVAQDRRQAMSAQEYLEVLRAWTMRIRQKGFEPTWIVEVNSQQKWLSQFGDFLRLKAELGITVIPHSTNRNKTDPEFGVRGMADVYGEHKVSIPWGDMESRDMFHELGIELQTYPQGEFSDCVMANWFFEHHIGRYATSQTSHLGANLPPWMLRKRELIDPRTQQSRNVGV